MSQVAAGLGALSQREFRVGDTISKTFKVFSRNALPFSLVGLVVWLPIGLISYIMVTTQQNQGALWSVAVLLLTLLLQLVVTAAILHATFQDMRGRPVRLGDSIQRGLGRFFPLIGGGILVGLGVSLASILLVVPGIILYLRWSVYAPVCVVEQMGPLDSMKRSAELTKGNRWKIVGIFVIVGLAAIVPGALIGWAALTMPPIASLAVQGVWHGVSSAFGSILSVVIYHDLRVAKEGADIESIASVFD